MALCVFSTETLTCSRCGHVAARARTFRECPARQTPAGAGTELSKLLNRLGINPTPTCPCREMAAKMDAWGCDEASKPERIDEVVAVMREEAKARGLPFIDAVGRMLVRRAIKLARKNSLDKP